MVMTKRIMGGVFVPLLFLAVIGCPMSTDEMQLPEDPPAGQDQPGPQGPAGEKGEPGPQGPQGEQGPEGASPFELIGDDAVYTQGNVGLGTDMPTERLEVAGNAKVNGTVFADAFSSNSPLLLQTAGTTRVYVDDATGRVGVGTMSPGAALDVSGSIRVTDKIGIGQLNTIERRLHIRDEEQLIIPFDVFSNINGGTFLTGRKSRGTIAAPLPVLGGDFLVSLAGHGNDGSGVFKVGADITFVSAGPWTTMNRPTRIQFSTTSGTTHSVKMRIEPTGEVGIGRFPTTNLLEVEGDASKAVAGDWLANSDRRIKKDIETVNDALKTLDRVNLVSFHYTDEYRAEHDSIADRRYLNVIAQEFAEVFPDYVQSSGENVPGTDEEILQVDPYPLTIYSAAAIQELHKLVREKDVELRRIIQDKDAEITELKARLGHIEQMLSGSVTAASD